MTTITVKPKEAGRLLSKIYYEVSENTFAAGSLLLKATLENAAEELQREGKPIAYPVRWDSERQRRAFFATNGFGRGIPTRRTSKYRLGWKVKQIRVRGRFASGYQLANDVRYSKWVGGDARGRYQSRIHRGRWIMARDAIDSALADLPEEMLKTLAYVARKTVQDVRP